MTTRSYNFSTFTNVELVSWALYALREYRERTGIETFALTEALLQDERKDLRRQTRHAIAVAQRAVRVDDDGSSFAVDTYNRLCGGAE